MPGPDLKGCIPKDKFDEAAVAALQAAGFPALNPVLPDLLEWLQDIDWPVARGLVPVLAGAGIAGRVRRQGLNPVQAW